MRGYEVHRQFSEGFAAAVLPRPREPDKGPHWLAGYDAGYAYRAAKNEKLNEYLISIGKPPQLILRPAQPAESEQQ